MAKTMMMMMMMIPMKLSRDPRDNRRGRSVAVLVAAENGNLPLPVLHLLPS